MNHQSHRACHAPVRMLALVITICWVGNGAQAQPRPAANAVIPKPSVAGLSQALARTMSEGVPTIAVVTSATDLRSQSLFSGLRIAKQQGNFGDVQLEEMPLEIYDKVATQLGVRQSPCVVICGRSPQGKLQVRGLNPQPGDVNQTLAWASSILSPIQEDFEIPAHDERPIRDPGLTKAQYASGQAFPSAQNPSTPTPNNYPPPMPKQPVTAPPPQPLPVSQPQPYTQAYAPPAFTAPNPAPTVITPPSAPIVVQPAVPTIMVGPAPAPNIIFAASPTPNISYVAPAPIGSAPVASAPPQPNLFTSAAAPPYQPANAPQPPANAPQPMGNSPQPMAYAPQPMGNAPQQPAYAPAPMAYAPAPAASAPVGNAMFLSAPNPIDFMLGSLGELLSRRKNPRLQMGSAPTTVPMAYAPAPMGSAPPTQAYGLYAPAPGYAPQQAYGLAYGPPPGYPNQVFGPPPGQGYGPQPGQGYDPRMGGPGYPPQNGGGGYNYPDDTTTRPSPQHQRESSWFHPFRK